MDAQGHLLPMGTDIDDLTEKALPNYFSDQESAFHANRRLLNDVMQQSGFHRSHIEWWHFQGLDQAWALIEALETPESSPLAIYGVATSD